MILRSYQTEAIESVFNYFSENSTGHPLLACPTGSGKALILTEFIRQVLTYWPNQRILQLVHTKELVEQNCNTFKRIMPNAPCGIFCAGLDSKEAAFPVVFGSLGSVRNAVEAFGWRDLLLIDEAHCISPDEATGYQKIIAGLMEINPQLRVIGLTATKFRLGQGLLTNDGLFTDICFDITGISAFNRLIAEGFLAPLIVPSQIKNQLDITGVAISKGEFNQTQLQKAVDKKDITYAAIKEALEFGYDRNCWLVFTSGIEHTEHVTEMLQSFGISAAAIHSKVGNKERDERINAFKNGIIKALVGFRVLTTGFDHPPIDLIIDLYPTVSPGMHVQKLGRGTRPYDGSDSNFPYVKRNCLVLDFAGNARRLGPINDPMIPRKKGDKTGDVPIKICEAKLPDGRICGLYNHASSRFCGGKPEPSAEGCGAEFLFKTKLVKHAGTDVLIAGDAAIIETYDVTRIIYHKHAKIGSMPSMKVSYYCGLQRYTEYVCLEHQGMAKTRALRWWQQRHAGNVPTTVDEALSYSSQLRCPKQVHVRIDTHFPEIIGVEW